VKSVGLPRLVAILGVTVGVGGALAAIMLRLGQPPMTVLYSDLPYGEAQRVIEQLEQTDTPYELKGGRARATILVPKTAALRLRMSVAEEGVVSGASVGYEIFDDESALGATAFQQNMNRLRALEGELARTITSLDGVRAARVHLVLPERELFAREEKKPSASIVVDAPAGLEPRSVRAVRNLVASAVPDMKPGRVTILDNSGALLAAAMDEGDDTGEAMAEMAETRTAQTEARLRRTVEDILGRLIGPDRVRVQVAADMNFDRISETSQIFDPDRQVVISTVTEEEAANSKDPGDDDGVSVGGGLPGADLGVDGGGAASTSSNQRTTETVNYEVSKTVRNEVREMGRIERLSVAVAVDGVYAPDPETGEQVYTPRTEEEIQRIEALVRTAVGYDESRGDRVEIVNMPFARPDNGFEPIAEPGGAFSLGKDDFMRIGEMAVLGLLGLVLALFVLRPMVSPGKGAKGAADGAGALPAAASGEALALAAPGAQGADGEAQALAGPDGQRALPAPDGENALQQHIDFARVQGKVKASSVQEMSQLVSENTEEAASVLRNWINEGA